MSRFALTTLWCMGLVVSCGLLLSGSALAEGLVDPTQMPGPLKEVGYEQNLGKTLPLDAEFTDALGRSVKLGDYFGERPVILAFVYYECPMLCSLIMNGLAKSVGVLQFDVGQEFDVVAISFDPDETPVLAAESKAKAVQRYGRPETSDGWHFLTGSVDAIEQVTEAAGFRYKYLPESDEFAHTSGIVVVTPQGVISQYYLGLEFPPKDVRLALVEASSNGIGSVIDQVLLYCFRYDPSLGKYTAITMRIVRLGGAVFALGLMLILWLVWRHERATGQLQRPTLGAT